MHLSARITDLTVTSKPIVGYHINCWKPTTKEMHDVTGSYRR